MLIALALATHAHALELRFWGVGPTLGTMVMPSEYPAALPDVAQTEAGDDRVKRVAGDLEFGAKGVLYPGPNGRLTSRMVLARGTNAFSRGEFTVGYDKVFYRDEELQFLVGGATGFGSESWPQKNDGPGRLDISYYPVRGEVNGTLRLGKQALELGLDGTWHLVSNGGWYDSDADDEPLKKEGLVSGAAYFALGAHATYYFGDFTAPGAPKKEKKKKGKGNRD